MLIGGEGGGSTHSFGVYLIQGRGFSHTEGGAQVVFTLSKERHAESFILS